MHQKVQIQSVFLIHQKLHFVNLSLGGNKMSMLAYKYPHKCLRKISKAICNYRLTGHFTLWLYVWSHDFPSKISIVFFDTARHYLLMAVFCHVCHFTDFICPRNNCVWALRFTKLVCLLIDTHTNPQRILVSLSAIKKLAYHLLSDSLQNSDYNVISVLRLIWMFCSR